MRNHLGILNYDVDSSGDSRNKRLECGQLRLKYLIRRSPFDSNRPSSMGKSHPNFLSPRRQVGQVSGTTRARIRVECVIRKNGLPEMSNEMVSITNGNIEMSRNLPFTSGRPSL